MEKSSNARVAVIGAGPAGLSAAWRLREAGCTVTVFERRASAGGRLRTDELDGVAFDAGVQLFGSNYTHWFELVRALGGGKQLVRSPGRDAVWRRGRANTLTYGSVGSMITSHALPATLKLKLGARYLPFLSRHARLDLHDLVHSGGVQLDAESIADWGERELGAAFVDLLAYPLLGAYYGSAPEETSAAVYHALARIGLDVAVHAAEHGMGRLAGTMADALAAKGVTFRFETAVDSVAAQSRTIHIAMASASEAFDGVVVAVPPAEAKRLLAGSAIDEWLQGVRTSPTCTLALVLQRRIEAEYFGLSIPRAEGPSPLVAICVQERKVGGLVPAANTALVAIPAPEQAAALAGVEPGAVLDRCLPLLERVFPGIRPLITRARVTAFPEGNTIFYPGYVRHLRAYDETRLPANVALAGDYLVAPTVEGAVRSGGAAAQRVLRSVSAG